MIKINIPKPISAENFIKGAAENLMFGIGMRRFHKPLPTTYKEINPAVSYEWLGVPTLTSLTLMLNNCEVLLEECILTVSQEKNIVSTALAGRNGTIKEYVSDGDYSIEVAAAIYPQANSNSLPGDWYPTYELNELIKIFKAADSLNVSSGFLTLFDIHSAVIKSYKFTQETHSNRQSFTMTMLSDTPYEIKIKEDA